MYHNEKCLKNKINQVISEISEPQLKELFINLVYEHHHSLFIKNDKYRSDKVLKAFNHIYQQIEPDIRLKAILDAQIKVPYQIIEELQEQNIENIKDLHAFMSLTYFSFVIDVIDLLESLIKKIDEKISLEDLRAELIEEYGILSQLTIEHWHDANNTKNHYKTKKDPSKLEKEELKRITTTLDMIKNE